MYRFVGRMTPDDVEAIAAQAYVEMLEAGFTRVGEFHYIHHDVSGAPYDDIGELAGRIAAAARTTRHRPDAAAGILCACRFRRRVRRIRGQRRFINEHRWISRVDGGQPPRRGGTSRAQWSASRRIRCAR